MEMTKRAVKEALGIQTDAELARQFTGPDGRAIGRWAVGQWPEDDPIPELRQLQLRAKHPDIFGAATITDDKAA